MTNYIQLKNTSQKLSGSKEFGQDLNPKEAKTKGELRG